MGTKNDSQGIFHTDFFSMPDEEEPQDYLDSYGSPMVFGDTSSLGTSEVTGMPEERANQDGGGVAHKEALDSVLDLFNEPAVERGAGGSSPLNPETIYSSYESPELERIIDAGMESPDASLPLPKPKQYHQPARMVTGEPIIHSDDPDDWVRQAMPDVERNYLSGRPPALTRKDCEAIKADGRTLHEIAVFYGVSVSTVRRVKQRGVYKGVEYIPADEYERNPANFKRAEQRREYRERKKRGQAGRPFTNREFPLSVEEKMAIAHSTKTGRELAARYGVSPSYISRIRVEHRLHTRPSNPMPIDQCIRVDKRDDETVALAYGMSVAAVKAIRALPSEVTDDDRQSTLPDDGPHGAEAEEGLGDDADQWGGQDVGDDTDGGGWPFEGEDEEDA